MLATAKVALDGAWPIERTTPVSTIFPKWTNALPTVLLGGVLSTLAVGVGAAWYYATPKYWRSGYMPAQPHLDELAEVRLIKVAGANPPDIPGHTYPGFSHQIHAGKLGMDCRYCHSHVEESPEANIPSVSTCVGCHADGHVNDELYAKKNRVQFVRDAWEAGVRYTVVDALKKEGKIDEAEAKSKEFAEAGLHVVKGGASLPWRRVHKVPDYVRNFPHHAHVAAGVSCYSCHGNIMEMPVVYQEQPLSMSWCLECHANPEPHLVPPSKVTDLYWVRDQLTANKNAPVTSTTDPLGVLTKGGKGLLEDLAKKPMHLLPQNCGACHY